MSLRVHVLIFGEMSQMTCPRVKCHVHILYPCPCFLVQSHEERISHLIGMDTTEKIKATKRRFNIVPLPSRESDSYQGWILQKKNYQARVYIKPNTQEARRYFVSPHRTAAVVAPSRYNRRHIGIKGWK